MPAPVADPATHPTAGPARCSLEDVFHLVVMIPIQTTNLLRFFRTLQFSSHKAVLRTIMSFNAQFHCRSTVVACYGTGAGFASTQLSGLPESDRCRESDAAVSKLYVFGSPPITLSAAFAARPAIHPTADRVARLAGAPPRARSCLAIRHDNAGHKPAYPHKQCPSHDTAPSDDSSRGSDLG